MSIVYVAILSILFKTHKTRNRTYTNLRVLFIVEQKEINLILSFTTIFRQKNSRRLPLLTINGNLFH